MSEKLVVAKDQRGFTVADVSIPNLKEVTALRGLLEPYAISASIDHADLAWEEKLISLSHRLDRLDSECKASPSAALIQEWELAHREFHLSLLEKGSMPLLSGICSTLYDLADRYRRLYLAKNPPQRCVADEHKAILQAVLNKDREAAAQELLDHINRTSDVVLSYMGQHAEA